MPTPASRLHFMFDSAVRSATQAKQAAKGSRPATANLGASLPGGQIFLEAEVVHDSDGYELLRTGDTRHSMWRTVEWRLLRTLVPQLNRPLLDLGCGDGGFGSLLTGRIEFGVDGDADAVSQCSRRGYGSAQVADLRQPLPIVDGSIAAAFSNSTLEHVAPLAPAIAAAARTLKPGGRLIATVPTDGLTAAMSGAYGPQFAQRMNDMFGHRNLWPWAKWEELLRSEGFSAVSFRGYLSRPAIAWYSQRSLAPWPQISRRRSEWLWQHDLPDLRRHVEESLRVTAEGETTCVLIDATKG